MTTPAAKPAPARFDSLTDFLWACIEQHKTTVIAGDGDNPGRVFAWDNGQNTTIPSMQSSLAPALYAAGGNKASPISKWLRPDPNYRSAHMILDVKAAPKSRDALDGMLISMAAAQTVAQKMAQRAIEEQEVQRAAKIKAVEEEARQNVLREQSRVRKAKEDLPKVLEEIQKAADKGARHWSGRYEYAYEELAAALREQGFRAAAKHSHQDAFGSDGYESDSYWLAVEW